MKKRAKKLMTNKDLDLLPVMNLFAIMIPFLLSVAQFEKLGILELNLPERSPPQPNTPQTVDIDDNLLNLSVIITDDKLTIAGGGGFDPYVFYKEVVEYRSRSDQHVFRKEWVKGEEVKSPTDGKVMSPFEKETIFLYYVEKKDSLDPGTFVDVAVDAFGNALIDSKGEWFKRIPQVGEPYRILGEPELKQMDPTTATFCRMDKLTAYQVVGKRLEQIHKAYSEREVVPKDVDDVIILAGDEVIYDKIIQVMDMAKSAGFERHNLSLLDGGA